MKYVGLIEDNEDFITQEKGVAIVAAEITRTDSPLKEEFSKKLNLSGGTMTGDLVLNEDPSENLQAATKHYVDDSIKTAIDNAISEMY